MTFGTQCQNMIKKVLLLFFSSFYRNELIKHKTNFSVATFCQNVAKYDDLLLVRYSATDDEIWQHTHGTQFWDKDVWILPIHRQSPEHWVLVAICPSMHQIFCFDSFTEIHPWKMEVKVNVIQIYL